MKINLSVTCIIVALVAFFCYLPDFSNQLLEWDDSTCITNNVRIHSLNIDTIIWAFTTFYHNCWTPFTWISLAIDYALWGANPIGYHLTNNILHALISGMFFLLSFYLITAYEQSKQRDNTVINPIGRNKAIYCSIFAALFFAIHPLRVESVVWAIERKDMLSSFFGIAAFIAYLYHVRYIDRITSTAYGFFSFISSPCYWLTFCLLSISLLAKAMLVTLPLSLLVLDWFPLKRHGNRPIKYLIFEKTPLFIPIIIASILNILSIKSIMSENEHINLITRLLIACKSIVSYLWLTIWPVDISPFYPHPGKNVLYSEYLLPVIIVFLISVAVLLSVRRYPVIMASWLFYLITLLPALGFTIFGVHSMAARFTYFPSFSIAMLVSLGLLAIVDKFSNSRPALLVIVCGMALALIYYGRLTLTQITFWKDDLTLWTRVLDLQAKEEHPIDNNWVVHSNMGAALIYSSMEAYSHLLEAIRINPKHDTSYLNLGIYYNRMKQHQLAIDCFNKALQVTTDKATPLYHLCMTYVFIGDCMQAIDAFRRIETIDPEKAHQLAGLLRGTGCFKDS